MSELLRFSKKDRRSLTRAKWSSSLLEVVACSSGYRSSTDMCRLPCFFLFFLLLRLLKRTLSAVPMSPGSIEALLFGWPRVRKRKVVGELGLTGVNVRLLCSPVCVCLQCVHDEVDTHHNYARISLSTFNFLAPDSCYGTWRESTLLCLYKKNRTHFFGDSISL